MGRLVKAFSKDDDDGGPVLDEAQFLREAGEVAARIQDELRSGMVESEAQPQERDTLVPPTAGRSTDHRSVNDTGLAGDRSSAANSGSQRHQLGRDAVSELDGEWSRFSQSPSLEGFSRESRQDGLRIFTEPESNNTSMQRPAESGSGTETIRQELLDELAREQARWAERHAMQVRSIDERTQHVARINVEVEIRERDLDRRERDLEARARELSNQADERERSRGTRDWESGQQETDRLASEVRTQTERASRFESELTQVRRQHAKEIDELRRRSSSQDDTRAARARSVIDECDERMTELAAERANWEAEQLRRRDVQANERLEQLAELNAARQSFKNKCRETVEQLDRERREWDEKFSSEQRELLDLRRTVESEVKQLRGDIAQEREVWESQQEQVRISHLAEQTSQQQQFETDGRELAAERAKFEQLKRENETHRDAQRKLFEAERTAWHRERGQEAAILQSERGELETESDRLRAERSHIEIE
ncbi:MAG: hypothetical protein O3B13_22760, partial [Planctomycetota bacterium]|nr:hypothetical protein [Planctomycetota bacterium]